MSILVSLIRLNLEFIAVTIGVILLIGILPTTWFPGLPVEPSSYSVPDLTSGLKGWNNVIGSKASRLLEGRIVGPESLAAKDGLIYTGLADGRLVEIDPKDQELRFITRFPRDPNDADECYDNIYFRLVKCGRPLGLRFDPSGHLLVVDAFTGLWKVNVTTGIKTNLGPGQKDGSGQPSDLKLFNDVIVDPANPDLVYISVSSAKWGLEQVPWSILDHEGSGSLIALSIKSRRSVKLLDGLYFANGIEISSDGQHLLVSECTDWKISKVSLDSLRKLVAQAVSSSKEKTVSSSTEKTASSSKEKTASSSKESYVDGTKLPNYGQLIKKETFASNLPGEPDNIRLHNGNIYVGIAITRAKGYTALDHMARIPVLRSAIARICYLSFLGVDYVRNNWWIHPGLEEVAFTLYSGHLMYEATPKAAGIVVLDGKTGSLKGILGSEAFAFISEAIIDESSGDIFFGSFRNRFLGRIKAKDVQFG